MDRYTRLRERKTSDDLLVFLWYLQTKVLRDEVIIRRISFLRCQSLEILQASIDSKELLSISRSSLIPWASSLLETVTHCNDKENSLKLTELIPLVHCLTVCDGLRTSQCVYLSSHLLSNSSKTKLFSADSSRDRYPHTLHITRRSPRLKRLHEVGEAMRPRAELRGRHLLFHRQTITLAFYVEVAWCAALRAQESVNVLEGDKLRSQNDARLT